MTERTRFARAVAALACATVALGLPGWAASASAGATRTSVTVLLRAPHPAALARLARERGPVTASRRAQLASLLPTADARQAVVRRLDRAGFAVTSQGTWQITATAPAAVVAATLGPDDGGVWTSPDELGTGVDTVVEDRSTPLVRPLATLSGADLRNAYAAAGTTASAGSGAASTTIATIQFASWNSANLTTYARSIGLPDPVASAQYTPVTVTAPGSIDNSPGGTLEVALDQEALLATSPTARQRAYFAPNTYTGFVQAFTQIAQDASRYHISAVSLSWGNCESAWGTPALESVLQQVTAAGVTVFASSGDGGIYGCSDGSVSPIYPASSPLVVSVGGTHLTSITTPSVVNTGSNWIESAWGCATATACEDTTGGSGGGASAFFSRPAWQTHTLSGSMANGTTRLVPDVAAVADPSTGFSVYSGSTWHTVGGTSLAAPVTAASFTNALTDAGVVSHPGDIHEALYAAYQNARGTVLRDVTDGANGAAADANSEDPAVCAGDGYDTVTGLGAVLWSTMTGRLGATTTNAPVAVAANACPAPRVPSFASHFSVHITKNSNTC